jgi:predicted MFS family arabinose efflux permease
MLVRMDSGGQDDRGAGQDGAAELDGGISRRLVLLLAVACGATVANLYYAQPLLQTLGRDFGVSDGTAGLLFTIGQIGYVLGLAFLVPLGDLRERRGLITATLTITGAGMALTALAPGVGVFAVGIAIVGFTSVMAMVIVPMSSSLAAEQERGRVVGTVMSGLLIGILLARTVSGLLAEVVSWRLVYWFGAAAMLSTAAALRRALPRVPPTTSVSYGELLRSVLALVSEQPVLRRRMLLGALTFGCFNTLWTSLSFLLSGPPFDYGNAVIGLFGVVGVVGAAAASVAGRLADRGHLQKTTAAGLLVMLLSWGVLALGGTSVIALIVGIAVLDLAAQAVHISNQNAIYALAPEARSRLTTAYMVAYFIGGATCSALSAAVYDSHGWDGVCILGAAVALVAVGAWAVTASSGRRTLARAQAAGD